MPYDDRENIDFSILEKEIDWLYENECDGIVFALASEVIRLTETERKKVAEKICKFNKLISTLAALPGAFVVIAGAINDIAKTEKESGQVIIPQATRVLFIVLFLPFIFVTQIGYQEIDSFGNTPTFDLRYFCELFLLQ